MMLDDLLVVGSAVGAPWYRKIAELMPPSKEAFEMLGNARIQ